jgi:hypothetical protein
MAHEHRLLLEWQEAPDLSFAEDFNTADEIDNANRMQEAETFQKEIHRQIFAEGDTKSKNEEEARLKQRQELVEKYHNVTVRIKLQNGGVIDNVPIGPLLRSSDIVYALVKSKHWNDLKKEAFVLTFLEQFEPQATYEFINLLTTISRSNLTVETVVRSISSECIIECCRIAHYLQSIQILNFITEIIESSIDSSNCSSICILANQLNLPSSLFEKSLSYVISSLDDISNNKEIWDDFPSTLQHQILTLKNAIQSSIVGKGQSAKVFFHNSDEFLAIFHDVIQEQKERLRIAQERQSEIISERKKLYNRRIRCAHSDDDVYSGDVKDAAVKIAKQEKRIQTLEAFYEEQKRIFSRDVAMDGKFSSSFSL